MSVANQPVYYSYTGDGTTTTFAFACKILAATDLVVKMGGVQLALGEAYSVNGVGADDGGTVVFAGTPAAGALVEIERVLPVAWDGGWPVAAPFAGPDVSREVDRIVMIMQQVDRRAALALQMGFSTSPEIAEYMPAPLAGAAIRWNSAANGLENTMLPAVRCASAHATLAAAVAACGSTPTQLVVDSVEAVTADLTVPATVHLSVIMGGVITITGGMTLVVSGPFSAPLRQVFSGSGIVRFGAGAISEVYPEWWGAVPDAATDCTDAFVCAMESVRGPHGSSYGGTVKYNGAYLISGKLSVPWGVCLAASGASINKPDRTPTSYFLKKSTMTVTALEFGENTMMIGGGVVYQSGATGDGIHINGNSVKLYNPTVTGVGYATTSGTGIRVGNDAGGSNCNTFLIVNPGVFGMSNHGIHIHDNASGLPDANAGTILHPVCNLNRNDGIWLQNCTNNTIIGPLCEWNGGLGIRIGYDTTSSGNNCVFGGDTNEGNADGTLALGPGTTYNTVFGGDHHPIIDSSANNTNTLNTPLMNFKAPGAGFGSRRNGTASLNTDSFSTATTIKTVSVAILWTERTVFGDASAGTITLTLPDAATHSGMELKFSRINSAGGNVVIAAAGGDLINGAATYTLTAISKFIHLQAVGNSWNSTAYN